LKFIVDAQLPKSLSELLQSIGLDSIHTLDLPEKNKTTDKEVTRIAMQESRVVITKDNDFLTSYLVKKEPKQLVIVSTGNVTNSDLLKLFELNISKMLDLLKHNQVIEINQKYLIAHY